jgi:hypothetical protein
VASADQQLPAAPVVHRERHVAQLERLEQLADRLGDPPHRKVCVRAHRPAMSAERKGRQHASVVGAQILDNMPPQRPVHDQPMKEHYHWELAAGVFVVDHPARELYCRHHAPPAIAYTI